MHNPDLGATSPHNGDNRPALRSTSADASAVKRMGRSLIAAKITGRSSTRTSSTIDRHGRRRCQSPVAAIAKSGRLCSTSLTAHGLLTSAHRCVSAYSKTACEAPLVDPADDSRVRIHPGLPPSRSQWLPSAGSAAGFPEEFNYPGPRGVCESRLAKMRSAQMGKHKPPYELHHVQRDPTAHRPPS